MNSNPALRPARAGAAPSDPRPAWSRRFARLRQWLARRLTFRRRDRCYGYGHQWDGAE